MKMSDDNCEHENVEWYSGQVGVVISINGDAFAKCLDCGAEAFTSEQPDADDYYDVEDEYA
jgi:hypothetical protein